MPRIPLVDQTGESRQLALVFDQLRQTRGRVPTMYRVLAHQPDILTAHRAYFRAALDTGILSRRFKEQVAFKTAAVFGSAYSTASHRRYALRHGVPEDELIAIEASDYGRLDTRRRVALEFAEEVAESGSGPTDETFLALTRFFSSAEIVELSALVGIMHLAAILGSIFDLEPDDED
jgi:alkylhydroperoxidase family enzyme